LKNQWQNAGGFLGRLAEPAQNQDDIMSYTYDIRQNPAPQGGGWNLHLFEDGSSAGLIDFPANAYQGAGVDPMKAAFQRAEAEAKLWIRGRKVYSKRRLRLVVHPLAAVMLGVVVLIAAYNILKYVF
jgi:hypothetical protein